MRSIGLLVCGLLVSCSGRLDLGKDHVPGGAYAGENGEDSGDAGSGALPAQGGHAGSGSPVGGSHSSAGESSTAGHTSSAGSGDQRDEEECGGPIPLTGCGVCPAVEDIVSADEIPEREWAQNEDVCTAHAEETRRLHEESSTGRVLSVAPLAGTWTEGSGGDRIELVLDAEGAGTLLIGNTADFPEIEDPSAPFLLGNEPVDLFSHGSAVPGFRYPVVADDGRGSEIQFHVYTAEAWGEWCSLQTPIRQDNCYACELIEQNVRVRGCGELNGCYVRVPDTELMVPVDCGRQRLCADLLGVGGPCQCTQEGCFATRENTVNYTATLDPVDPTVLRLTDTSFMKSYYLTKE